MKHFCLYHEEKREIEHEREVKEDAKLCEELTDHLDKKDLLVPFLTDLYNREAFGRGCGWKAYVGDEPFSFPEVEKAAKKAVKE